jgi:uncharacterized protein involved in response to NO
MNSLRLQTHDRDAALMPDPYRVLFPLGVAFALIGVGLWPMHALGLTPYPGPLHRALMIQGFEHSFISGFLLTAMPAFTHGARCHPIELGLAAALLVGFGVAAWLGATWLAQIGYLLAIGLLLAAGIRRIARNPQKPPEEFVFVAFGLALGVAGGALLLAEARGVLLALPPRFGDRLLSLGMVLSLVVGVGSLLVPTFAGLKEPLAIPGVAKPHERRGRRALYASIMAALALAFALESRGHASGMAVRATAVTVMVVWVWKLYRLPRRDVPAFVLWGSGWFLPTGLWAATLFPTRAIGVLHLTFIGGFAMLTLGVGTRVIVSHGKHAFESASRVLSPAVVSLMLLALALRLTAEVAPARAMHAWAASGVAWLAAWGWWSWRVLGLSRGR